MFRFAPRRRRPLLNTPIAVVFERHLLLRYVSMRRRRPNYDELSSKNKRRSGRGGLGLYHDEHLTPLVVRDDARKGGDSGRTAGARALHSTQDLFCCWSTLLAKPLQRTRLLRVLRRRLHLRATVQLQLGMDRGRLQPHDLPLRVGLVRYSCWNGRRT